MDSREQLRELAREALRSGKPEAWFQPLYERAGGDPSVIPWADLSPNPHLVAWLDRNAIQGSQRNAVVIGCGLGDDAEELARRGFAVTAFDLAPAAIQWAKRRFTASQVMYHAQDLLNLPAGWHHRFDFVFEAYTVQSMPHSHRQAMLRAVASLVAPGGELLLICRGRVESDDPGNLPWPLTRNELSILEDAGLVMRDFEDFIDHRKEPTRRFRATFHR